MSGTPTPDESAVPRSCADEGSEVDHGIAQEWPGRYGDDDEPASFDDPRFRDEDLLAVRGPVSEWDLVLLASIDPATLDREGRALYLRRLEGVESLVAARKARATVALAGVDGSDSRADRHVAMEVAQLRRVGEGAALTGIATARALQIDYPHFLQALQAGEVSEWHCRILVSETVNVSDAGTIAALQERLLPKAKRKTPGQFRRDVRAAVADLDATRAAERFRRARSNRYVTCTPLPDGLGHLGVVSDWATISAMHATVTADGRALQLARGGAQAAREGDDTAYADACRADAFAARVLGTIGEDGEVSWDRDASTSVTLTLVMDLDTVRDEADHHALLDGEPIPAGIARELAEGATLWRRAVTDPVTGHLLDYGREQYLPDKLRGFVLARDLCRAPGCTARAASRLEMDHATPFPEGATSAANCGGLCRRHHQMKTEGRADLIDSAADGSATWITAWGQRITIPPRPFLHDPADHHTDTTSADGAAPAPPPKKPDSPGDVPPF